jgi:hypothetical protein
MPEGIDIVGLDATPSHSFWGKQKLVENSIQLGIVGGRIANYGITAK